MYEGKDALRKCDTSVQKLKIFLSFHGIYKDYSEVLKYYFHCQLIFNSYTTYNAPIHINVKIIQSD